MAYLDIGPDGMVEMFFILINGWPPRRSAGCRAGRAILAMLHAEQ